MSTRSIIAIENKGRVSDKAKKYTGIYCQSDGYISYVGLMLYCFYSDEQMVRQLMGLGALSAIGPEIGKPIDLKKSYVDTEYYDRIKGQCRAYSRDAGQAFEVIETNNQKVLLSEAYCYIFRYGEWYYRGGDAQRLSKVSIAIKKDKDIDKGLEEYIYEMCDNDHKRIFIEKLQELGICKIKPQKAYDYTILGKIKGRNAWKAKCNINNSIVELDADDIKAMKRERVTIDAALKDKVL